MLRFDVDIWYSFISRTASRPEFVDIHEQFLVGFPDMSWENVRRVDMEDGWVFSEVKLKGTNKGKFLGKGAPGLPMEVRSGLIEHYDAKGLADCVHFHFDTLSVPGQEAPTGPVEDFSNVFFMELSPGLNMISPPLKPSTPFTARSLAEHIGATVVIKYDEAMGKFVGFDPKAQGNGFAIEGGKGYIVNVPKGGTAMFTGAAWTNEPSTPAAPAIAQRNNAWAFMLSGFLVDDDDGIGISDGNYTLTVKNLSTGERFTGTVDTGGYFSLAWADLSRKPVVYSGHRLEIAMKDANGKLVSGPFIQEVTLDDIRDALANRWMKLGHIIPKQTALLQNYPNPFNPETWIPFQLAQDADVSVRIYHASGKLLREIALGRKEAGIYVDKSKAIYWDGKSDSGEKVAIGVYFYTIQAGEFSSSRKMIVNK